MLLKAVSNLIIQTYTNLLETLSYYVTPMNYASGVWVYDNFLNPQLLESKIFFLHVIRRFAPLVITKID